MAQPAENKLKKIFDQNVEITGTLTVGGSAVSTTVVNKTFVDALNIDADLLDGQQGSYYAIYDHIRSLGTQAFTGTATTAGLISEMESDGAFDSYTSVFKTSWSYAGNFNLADAGRFTETAGSSWITWTDNSSDSDRGNITALAIAPNTGGSAGKVFIYNDQGSGYAPGWREVWTSTSDGAGSGLDADLWDGNQFASYLNQAVLSTSSPSFTDLTLTGGNLSITNNNGGIDFNDASGYWLRTATSWGLYWNTSNNTLGFHGSGTERGYVDLDNGNFQMDGTGTFGGALSATTLNTGQGANELYAMNQNVRTTDSVTFANISGTLSGTAANANHLNTTRDTPSNSLQYWQANGLGITEAPSGDWHNTIRMGHGSPLSYYSNTLAVRMTGTGVGDIYTQTIVNGSPQGWKKHWNDGNDGAGSGLDADLLDGQQGSYYQPVNGTIPLYRGAITSQDWNNYIDGTEAGYYQVSNASGANRPPAYAYGTELNFSVAGANKLQIYAPHDGTDGRGVWIRTGWSSDYDAWREVAMYGMAPYSGGDLRASIFYDSDNTGYYLDPANTSKSARLRGNVEIINESPVLILNDFNSTNTTNQVGYISFQKNGAETGYVGFGSSNTDILYLSNYSGRVYIASDYTEHSNSSRAPIFYDSNNTGYYTNPASTSNLNQLDVVTLNVSNKIIPDLPSDYGQTVLTSLTNAPIHYNDLNVGTVNTYLPLFHASARYNSGYRTHMNIGLYKRAAAWGESQTGMYVALGGNDSYPTMEWRFTYGPVLYNSWGYVENSGSFRAPIFYDSNNTGYYIDAASTSVLKELDVLTIQRWYRQGGLAHQRVDARLDGTDQARSHWYGKNDTGDTYNFKHAWYDGSSYINVTAASGAITFDRSGGTADIIADGSFRAPIFYDSDNTGYYLDPAGTSNLNAVKANSLYLGREESALRGINWYSPSYKAWTEYMSPAGATSCGPTANITAPSGTIVTSWAQRTFIENAGNYGWTWESGTAYGQPSVVAEIRSSDGLAQFNGGVITPGLYDSNNTGYYADFNSTGTSINIAGSVNAATYNKPGLLVNASGTSSSGGALGIQQVTGEGWTGIFVDFEPYTGWGLWHDNPNNYFSVTAETSLGQIRSFGVPSRQSGTRTAYEKFRIDQNNGNIIIGSDGYAQSSFRAPLFYDSNNTGYYVDPASASRLNQVRANYLDVLPNAAYGVRFWDGNNGYSIRMSESSSGTYGGRVGGETTSDYNMYFTMADGTNRGFVFNNGLANAIAGIDASGNGRFEGDVIAFSASDKRLKDNIKPIENALEKVNKISGVEFDWNSNQDTYADGMHDIGVIAQEIEEVIPEVVKTRDNGYKAVKYEKIVPLLIEAIKEQQKQIDELKQLINK